MAKKQVKKAIKKAVKKSVTKKSVTKKSVAKKTVVKKATPAKKAVKKVSQVKVKPAVKVKKVNAKKTTKKMAPQKVKATEVALQKIITPAKVKIDYAKAITPLGDRLIVKLTQTEKVTSGGIILPDSASFSTGYLKGQVLAAGHGGKSKKGHVKLLDVKVGDLVLFAQYSGTPIKFHGEELFIVPESEILGVTN